MTNVGIYIKTFERDYHLARALVSSIRRHSGSVPITIVPGDGHTRSQIWGENALVLDDPFLERLEGYFKKMWVFFGPYDRFVYLDADTLALKSVEPLLRYVAGLEEPFFAACRESKFDAAYEGDGEDARRAIVRDSVGDEALLAELDPGWRSEGFRPFNSSFFATHRSYVDKPTLRDVFEHANAINERHGKPRLYRSREGVFMGDQGLLNYLVWKTGVPPLSLPDVFVWGGRADAQLASPGDSPLERVFVTWAGNLRPTLIRRSVPAGREWARDYVHHFRTNGGPLSFVGNAARHVGRDEWLRFRRWAARRLKR